MHVGLAKDAMIAFALIYSTPEYGDKTHISNLN
jgi:hypothetical protein